MTSISPKATVPVLQIATGEVIEHSLDIMIWALERNDPMDWLTPEIGTRDEMMALIEQCEENFKPQLDRYKYANRYEDADPIAHRQLAEAFLKVLENRLSDGPNLFGTRPALADFAIAPFIRQFANTDRDWFDQTPYPAVHTWLSEFLNSPTFSAIMTKYNAWAPGDTPVLSATAGV